ncbi:hypothetical protein Trydic_g12235 [Trypoxylus dichotomus]
MRRTRRHKFLQISLLFLIYVVIHVHSEKSKGTEEEVEDETENYNETLTTIDPTILTTETEIVPFKTTDTTVFPVTVATTQKPKTHSSTTANSSGQSKPENSPLSRTTSSAKTTVPTLRPKRNNCTPPAIEQFPKPLMGPEGRRHGGIIIHVLVAVYTFIGLAIVCDEYFVASLDRICEELKLSPDVAGATFMAAGSSAPELATVIIGVFFAKDDIGVSGVIGSAVFNIMFVISVCALCTNTVCYLNWWPLVRDCFFYAVSILVMLFTIYNETISWGESLFMLFMYLVYCIVLHFNPQLERWAQTLPVPCKNMTREEASGLVSYKTLDEEKKRNSYGSPDRSIDNVDQVMDMGTLSGPALNQPHNNPPYTGQGNIPPTQQGYYRPREQDPNSSVNPLEKPVGKTVGCMPNCCNGSLYQRAKWAIVYPIHYMARKTMPDCKSEKYRNWYPFTFFVSMVWISFYSYFMVWMITIIGSTLNIPDTVMGLTFVAAGVSVPDALSSIAVLKEGYGDMAVSNAVGSNVFDILVCLGLPWFIQTAIIKPGSHVNVISKGLTYSTLSLLSTVVFLVGATHLNGWKLDRKYGIILMIWYLIFITFASMYELNVFGQLNPPECPSRY